MVLSFAAVLMLGLLAAGHADSKTVLFSGSLQGAELGSWGSGTIELDEEESYLEGEALRVETTGFYEGGRLQLTQPLAADTFLSDPEGGYVRLVVKVHEPEEQAPVGPGGMMGPGGFPADPGMMPAEPGMFPAEPGMMPPEPGSDVTSVCSSSIHAPTSSGVSDFWAQANAPPVEGVESTA